MIIRLKNGASQEDFLKVSQFITAKGLQIKDASSDEVIVFGVIGDTSKLEQNDLYAFECVAMVTRITVPYKRASRAFKPQNTVITFDNGLTIGDDSFVVMAGPCSVESEEQTLTIAREVKKSGAHMLRGGVYKPRTSPYAFQGLGLEGLEILNKAKKETGLLIVSEIMSVDMIEPYLDKVDMFQVGARNMQNFHLLKELGKINKPILLKRGLSATIEEWLMSAEYILAGGNEQVILCERGIRTFEKYTRNTLDISAVLAVKELSHLPVIIDPSHAAGKWSMIDGLSKASLAVGADGIIVEVHNNPESALSDGAQSLKPERFDKMMQDLKLIAPLVNKHIK